MRSEADRLNDWQGLGRKAQFVFRGLIAGPPPSAHKAKSKLPLIFSDGQFDKMVNLADQGPPTPALLADFAASDAKP